MHMRSLVHACCCWPASPLCPDLSGKHPPRLFSLPPPECNTCFALGELQVSPSCRTLPPPLFAGPSTSLNPAPSPLCTLLNHAPCLPLPLFAGPAEAAGINGGCRFRGRG